MRKAKHTKLEDILEVIRGIENPYPKDIFLWDNEEKLDIDRGRFNEFVFSVVENTKWKIIKELKEQF